MPDDELFFQLAGEDVIASAERALFWPAAATLFVADVHFGKDSIFRQAHRWVPPGTTTDDLARLSKLIARYQVRRLVILGDAFHSAKIDAATREEIREWRASVPIDLTMVRGNHDLRTDDIAADLGFAMQEEGALLGPWRLFHHPNPSSPGYVLCGHLHPVASARGKARQSLRLPCFWASDRQCVLPSFGGFTGGSIVRPKVGDRVILVAGEKVLDAATCSR